MSKLLRVGRADDALIEQALSQPAGPSPDTIFTVQQLGSLLAGITRQLDLLIRLECNALKRADLRSQILNADNAAIIASAAQTEEVATDESEDDPALG